MFRLEKSICIIYICLTITIGGGSAYFAVKYSEANYIPKQEKQSNSHSKLSSNSNKNKEKISNVALIYKKYGQVVNVNSNVCIRQEPDLDSDINYYLYEGMTFDILEKNNNWYKIKYNEVIGYVNEDYVEEYDEIPSNPTYDEVQNKSIFNNLKIPMPIEAELTAYCNCVICSEAWGAQTSMQTHTRTGVAAAPMDIPLGSRLFIPTLNNYKEDGIFKVEDRGGAVIVKNDGTHIIDIWLPTHEEVEEFGRVKTMVYFMKEA